METIIKRLATLTDARLSCKMGGNKVMEIKHNDAIEHIIQECLPSGNGINRGIEFDYEASTSEKIVLHSSIEIVNNNSFVEGYVVYVVIVTASLRYGIDVTLHGNFRDSADIYLEEDLIEQYYASFSMDVG